MKVQMNQLIVLFYLCSSVFICRLIILSPSKGSPMLSAVPRRCLGHLALMIASHNWCYGLAMPQPCRDRHPPGASAPLILAFPLGLSGHVGWDLDGLPHLSSEIRLAAAHHTLFRAVCRGRLRAVFRLNTALRAFASRSDDREAEPRYLDVAKQLGYRPVGTSKERLSVVACRATRCFRSSWSNSTIRLPRLPACLGRSDICCT